MGFELRPSVHSPGPGTHRLEREQEGSGAAAEAQPEMRREEGSTEQAAAAAAAVERQEWRRELPQEGQGSMGSWGS